MNTIIIIGVLIFLSWCLTWIVKKIALKKSIIDRPNERSSHKTPTPRGGGLAIAISWFLCLFYLFLTDNIQCTLFYALSPGLILIAIGLLDDIYDISPRIRFLAQILVATISLYFLNGITKVNLGYFEINSVWILTPIAFVGIIWFINLYNFLDGIDGYAASETIFIALAFYTIYNENILLFLAAAVFGFIIWNWQPAKIFMGDVGSTLLGFNIIIITLYYQNTTSVSILSLLLLSSLFWFDATLTLIRRIRKKEKVTEAHKKHAYQRIVQYGFSHQKTVLLGMLINLILYSLAILSCYNKFVIFPFILGLVLLYLITFIIDKLKRF